MEMGQLQIWVEVQDLSFPGCVTVGKKSFNAQGLGVLLCENHPVRRGTGRVEQAGGRAGKRLTPGPPRKRKRKQEEALICSCCPFLWLKYPHNA